MLLEAGQAAQEAAKSSASVILDASVIGLVVTNSFLLIRDLVKSRTERQKARDAADEAEAKALRAQADALAANKAGQTPGKGSGNGVHEKYVLPHSLTLERHEGEIKAINGRFEKFEKDNSDQHGKIFDKLDDIKDLVIGKSAGAA
jgi:hypothetical protein